MSIEHGSSRRARRIRTLIAAAVTSVVLTIQPVGAVLLGIWLLGESPSALQLLGVLFILAGLLLTALRVRSPEARRAQPETG